MFNPKEHLVKITRTNRSTGEKTVSDYLETRWRIVWAKEEHPEWIILPTVDLLPQGAVPEAAIATVEIYESDKLLAREFGYCEKKDFARFVEKAVTTAIGRALALLGYGTQWAQEYEEELEEEEETEVEMVELKDEPAPTEKQIGLIHGLVKSIGLAEEQYKELLKKEFNVTSSKELRGSQIQKLIDLLKAQYKSLKEQGKL